jgi:FKBP-type peptidyl-prolyl cis-trans isomerase/tetratricopeptide (TPR) repeat protein
MEDMMSQMMGKGGKGMGGMGGMGGKGGKGGKGGGPEEEAPDPEPEFALADEAKAKMVDTATDGSVLKTVLTAGDGSKATPTEGMHVLCHYTGRLMNGAKFDSSHDRKKPFSFKIGSGVIKGWSEGVATMEVGEVALFCLAPEKAYGASGSPPVIPENASLQFEIELLSFSEWEPVDGSDGAVTKNEVVHGEGYQKPGQHDVCLLRMTLSLEKEGTVLHQWGEDAKEEAVQEDGKEDDKEAAADAAAGAVFFSMQGDKYGDKVAGLQLALRKMKIGAKWEVRIEPSMGYGAEGCADCAGCPDVPPNAKLLAKIELVDIVEVRDVTRKKDGGVLLKVLGGQDGEGWKRPGDGSHARISYKLMASAADGEFSVLREEGEPSMFTLGDLTSGEVHVAGMEVALREMKKGCKAELTIDAEYAFGAEGHAGLGVAPNAALKLELELHDWQEVNDITKTVAEMGGSGGDGSDKGGVMMTTILESVDCNDYDTPKELAELTIQLTLSTGDKQLKALSTSVKHTVDEAPECDDAESADAWWCALMNGVTAVECALKKMKRGGKAELTVTPEYAFGAEGHAGLGVAPNATIKIVIELVDFANEKGVHEFTGDDVHAVEEEKIAVAEKKKAMGNKSFKTGKLVRALRRYGGAKAMLAGDGKNQDEEQKAKAKAIQVAVLTNSAICHTKLGDNAAAVISCDHALMIDSECVKALFRRGAIRSKQMKLPEAAVDLKRAYKLDPSNTQVRKELQLLKKRQAAEKAAEKKKFGGIFDKLSKGGVDPRNSAQAKKRPAVIEGTLPAPLDLAKEDGGASDKVPTMDEAIAVHEGTATPVTHDGKGGGDSVKAAQMFTQILRSREASKAAGASVLVVDEKVTSEVWRRLGECHAANDDDRKAVSCLAAAVEKDETNMKALASAGTAYFNESLHERAIQHLRSWIANHPTHKGLLEGTGGSGDNAELELDELTEVYRKAVSAESSGDVATGDAADATVVLGVLCNLAAQFEDAAKVLRAGTKLAPEDYSLWNKLGATLANAGGEENLKEALEAYQRALQIRPSYIRGHVNLAIAYQNQKRDDLAALQFLRALEYGSAMGTADARRGMSCWDLLKVSLAAMQAQVHKPPPEMDLLAKYKVAWETAAVSGEASRTVFADIKETITGGPDLREELCDEEGA